MDETPLCPFILTQFSLLRRAGPPGVAYQNVRDASLEANPMTGGHSLGDRFILEIPYCRVYLKWPVIFSRQNPTQPPDIILTTPPECLPQATHQDGLPPEWYDPSSGEKLLEKEGPEALVYMVVGALQQFRAHQAQLVAQIPNEKLQHCLTEFNSVCDIHNVEYLKLVRGTAEGCYRFRMLIPLNNVDLKAVYDDLPTAVHNPRNEKCRLFLEIRCQNGGNVTVVTSELDWPVNLLPVGWLVSHPYPPFQINHCGLASYIVDLGETINECIKKGTAITARKRQLLERLVIHMGTPLEFTQNGVHQVSFLTDQGDAPVVVTISLAADQDFPKDQPTVKFASVGVAATKEEDPEQIAPVRCVMEDCHYNKDWTVDEYCIELKKRIFQLRSHFEHSCSEFR